MVTTSTADNGCPPPLPYWLKQQQGNTAATLATRSEQRDLQQFGHSNSHVPLASLLQGDAPLGQIELENHIGGFSIGALAANGLSINTATNPGTGPTTQQQISQEVLNLYGLLTKISLPQGQQARTRVPSLMQDQASFRHGHGLSAAYGHNNVGNGGCPQPLPFEQQYALPQNGHQDFRGSSDARGAVDPLLSFVTQGQDPMYLPLTAPNQAPQYTNDCGSYRLAPYGAGASLSRFDGSLPGFHHASMVDHQNFASAGGHFSEVVPAQTLKKPAPKHPLRALSAYNFFFRDERDRIVNETEGEYDISAEKKRELLEIHWYRDRTIKRRHRKTHGKIAFTELSKVISQRWKGLPVHVKSFYHDVAAEDSLRYNREVDAQKSVQF